MLGIEINSGIEDVKIDENGMDELQEFLCEWNKKYGLDYFCENNIAVLVPEDILKEWNNER